MPVVVTAVFHPVEGRAAELIDALRAGIPAVHNEQGCRLYAIHDADDGTITMIWRTCLSGRHSAMKPAVHLGREGTRWAPSLLAGQGVW
jgi:hypothetical protein